MLSLAQGAPIWIAYAAGCQWNGGSGARRVHVHVLCASRRPSRSALARRGARGHGVRCADIRNCAWRVAPAEAGGAVRRPRAPGAGVEAARRKTYGARPWRKKRVAGVAIHKHSEGHWALNGAKVPPSRRAPTLGDGAVIGVKEGGAGVGKRDLSKIIWASGSVRSRTSRMEQNDTQATAAGSWGRRALSAAGPANGRCAGAALFPPLQRIPSPTEAPTTPSSTARGARGTSTGDDAPPPGQGRGRQARFPRRHLHGSRRV